LEPFDRLGELLSLGLLFGIQILNMGSDLDELLLVLAQDLFLVRQIQMEGFVLLAQSVES